MSYYLLWGPLLNSYLVNLANQFHLNEICFFKIHSPLIQLEPEVTLWKSVLFIVSCLSLLKIQILFFRAVLGEQKHREGGTRSSHIHPALTNADYLSVTANFIY